MKYFFNKQITEITLPEQGYKVGNDIEEINAFIPLNDKQLLDLEQHTDWSAMEVWQGFKNPIIPIPEPTPIELFDYLKCTSRVREVFGIRFLQIEPYCLGSFLNLQLKRFDLVWQAIMGHIQLGNMTLNDYNMFRDILLEQNIDLNNFSKK